MANYPSPPPYSGVCSSPSGVGKVSSSASVGSPNFSGGSASSPSFTPILPPRFGPNPVEMDCPNCDSRILTNTTTKDGALTWIVCFSCFLTGGCFFGICCFFCWVPFCIEDCMDIVHSCKFLFFRVNIKLVSTHICEDFHFTISILMGFKV